MTGSFPVNIGTFLVIHVSKNTAEQLKSAIENGDAVDFGEVDENEVNIVAEFDGIGQGEVV